MIFCSLTASPSPRFSVAKTMVDRMAPTIASSFNVVGVVENRVSMVAENRNPGGAGPVKHGADALADS